MTLPAIYSSLSELTLLLINTMLNQIIKCLNQIISKNKPYNLRICTFTLNKFQEKNLNLNRDLNSDTQISSLALCSNIFEEIMNMYFRNMVCKYYSKREA